MVEQRTKGASKPVESNQQEVHKNLITLTQRYQTALSARPISEHTEQAFMQILPWLQGAGSQLILDACCGVGESTAILSRRYCEAKVLGVDKSAIRLQKHHAYEALSENYQVIRADLNDFWRLLAKHKLTFKKQYLLYPNPYPKVKHIQKRWYACPVTPDIMKASNCIEVRSNWLLYLQEFAVVAEHYGFNSQLSLLSTQDSAMTPFERKYQQSGQACYKLLMEKQYD
jgi:tRNA G46 methylase TrmB